MAPLILVIPSLMWNMVPDFLTTHKGTAMSGVDMKVREAAGGCGLMIVMEPKRYESQEDPSVLQESAGDDGLDHGCQLHNDIVTEDAVCTRKNNCSHSLPFSETQSSEKETDLCTDKSDKALSDLCTDKAVIEVSPELVCCCKEGGYHVIKDICVDEGLPSKEKYLLENCETDKKRLPNLVHLDVDEQNDVSAERVTTGASIVDDFPVDSEGKQGKDHTLQLSLSDKEAIYNDNLDKSLIGGWPGAIKYIACEKLMSNEAGSVVSTAGHHAAKIADSEVGQQKDNQVRTQEKTTDSCITAEDTNFNSTKEVNCLSSTEAQNGSIIINSELPGPLTMADRSVEEAIDYKDGCQDSHVLAEHGLEHGGSVGLGASCQGSMHFDEMNCSETRNSSTNQGELSGNLYPGRNSTSDSIANCGPVAYSGSISLRSDSSTTSTHSFAFPILASEWNTSPVKMSEADRKQFRRHRGWKMALLCCRF